MQAGGYGEVIPVTITSSGTNFASATGAFIRIIKPISRLPKDLALTLIDNTNATYTRQVDDFDEVGNYDSVLYVQTSSKLIASQPLVISVNGLP